MASTPGTVGIAAASRSTHSKLRSIAAKFSSTARVAEIRGKLRARMVCAVSRRTGTLRRDLREADYCGEDVGETFINKKNYQGGTQGSSLAVCLRYWPTGVKPAGQPPAPFAPAMAFWLWTTTFVESTQ